jgi:hypothetical protein
MSRHSRWFAFVPLVLAMLPATLAAQSARAVLERMLAEYDRRAEGIQDYTIAQEVMGHSMTMYYEKDTSGPHPVFRIKKVIGPGGGAISSSDRSDEEFWKALPELMDHARSGGTETVDGHATQVVHLDDLDKTGLGRSFAPENSDFTPRQATLYVDSDLWIPRRMIFQGTLKMEGRQSDITMTMDAQDIRDVDGLLQPFHTRMRIDGLGDAIDPEMRQKYEDMKKQLAAMPESQRQMVEKMMKGQMAQMEQMMEGDGGMNVEMVVHDVRVNAGPPQ